ncbi:MAG: hypothetical protein ACI9MR_000854 [Myxococcota bacterium]
MKRYTAFLRGMNVGGRRITNVDLCACFDTLGFTDVTAFLASGNVVFSSPDPAEAVRLRVADGLSEHLSYKVPTFIRSGAEVQAAANYHPFADRPGADARGKLQIAFFAAEATPNTVTAVAEYDSDADWLMLHGRELYWLPTGSISESSLKLKAVERLVDQMTVRTQRTVQRIAVKFFRGA